MRKLLLIIVLTVLTWTFIPFEACDAASQPYSELKLNWNKAFGNAVMDWLVDSEENSITIEVDWNAASWGLGAEILLEEPINLKDVAEIEATVYALYDSPTKVYIMVATPDDANLSFPSVLAYPVTSTSDKFIFPIKKMVKYKPDTTSRNFEGDDWQKVDRIKFILSKPLNYSQLSETIIIKDIRIIPNESTETKVSHEKPVIVETKETAETVKKADVEDRVLQANEYNEGKVHEIDELRVEESKTEGINEYTTEEISGREVDEVVVDGDIGKERTAHFQSLEKLMDEYPSDESKKNVTNFATDGTPELIFKQVSIYEYGVQEWKTMDDANKFFFDVNWKNEKSGFTIDFHATKPVAASAGWYLVFTAQTLNRSKPRASVITYYEDEYDLSFPQDTMVLKNKPKTFYVPLKQRDRKRRVNTEKDNKLISRIELSFHNKKSPSKKEDIIVVKDIQLLRK